MGACVCVCVAEHIRRGDAARPGRSFRSVLSSLLVGGFLLLLFSPPPPSLQNVEGGPRKKKERERESVCRHHASAAAPLLPNQRVYLRYISWYSRRGQKRRSRGRWFAQKAPGQGRPSCRSADRRSSCNLGTLQEERRPGGKWEMGMGSRLRAGTLTVRNGSVAVRCRKHG